MTRHDLVAFRDGLSTRRYLCLSCRRLLGQGERCPRVTSHKVLDLARDMRALERVCRPTSVVEYLEVRARWAIRTVGQMTLYGVIPVLALAIALVASEGLEALTNALWITLGVTPFVLLYHGVNDGPLFPRLVHKAERARLVGAEEASSLLPAAEALRGRVAGEHAITSPASATACLAYALELIHQEAERSGVMFCDAVTSGFSLELLDGRTVRVDPGPIELRSGDSPGSGRNRDSLRCYLRAIDERLATGRDDGAVAHDRVREVVLRSGDCVELVANTRHEFELTGATNAYRSAPSLTLVARRPVFVSIASSEGG